LIDDVDLEGGTALIFVEKNDEGQRSTRRVPFRRSSRACCKTGSNSSGADSSCSTQQAEVCRSKTQAGRPASLGALSHDEAHDHFQRVIKGLEMGQVEGGMCFVIRS